MHACCVGVIHRASVSGWRRHFKVPATIWIEILRAFRQQFPVHVKQLSSAGTQPYAYSSAELAPALCQPTEVTLYSNRYADQLSTNYHKIISRCSYDSVNKERARDWCWNIWNRRSESVFSRYYQWCTQLDTIKVSFVVRTKPSRTNYHQLYLL